MATCLRGFAGRDRYRVKKVGRQWWKDVEIDVLGLGNVKVAGECKWSKDVNPHSVLANLEKKVERLGLTVNRCVLFARSFSTREKMEKMELVEINDLNSWFMS